MAGGDSEKIIYSMIGVTKTVNRKEILKDVVAIASNDVM